MVQRALARSGALLPCFSTALLCISLASSLSLTHKAVAATLLFVVGLSAHPQRHSMLPSATMPCVSWFAVGFVLPKLVSTAMHDGPLVHSPVLDALLALLTTR